MDAETIKREAMDGKMNEEYLKSTYGTFGFWDGMVGYQFILYGLRSSGVKPLNPPDFSIWAEGVEYHHFIMFNDDSWPIRIDLFDIYCPHLPDNLEDKLADGMHTLLTQGAVLSFYMFEGAFMGIDRLFASAWEVSSVYGVAYAGQEPIVRLDEAGRADPAWLEVLETAEDYFYGLYPELRTYPSEQ